MERGQPSRSHSRESSVGSSTSLHSTRSLHSTDFTHVVENGRTYPNPVYYMPCDSLEQTRLEILHRVFLTALDGSLTTAPLTSSTHRILDVGTGPGSWANQMADRFPDAEIVAVDIAVWELSPSSAVDDKDNIIWEIDDLEPCITPLTRPSSANPQIPTGSKERLDEPGDLHPLTQDSSDLKKITIDPGYASRSTNCTVSEGPHSRISESLAESSEDQENSNDEENKSLGSGGGGIASWDFSEPFDFIHIRNMKGAFRGWGAVIREAYSNLVPGGMLEVSDLLMQFAPSSSSSASSFTMTTPKKPQDGATAAAAAENSQSALQTLVTATIEAAERAGRSISLAHIRSPALLAAAGFVDIHTRVVDLPMGPWPNDEKRSLMGKMWLVACAEGIEALCLRLLTREAGWSVERVRAMVSVARTELLEGRHGGVKTEVVFAWGRRPKRRSDGKTGRGW